MPLLKKKALEKAPLPEFLRDDEEVFHCQMTNEIFRDYEDFAERTILCNSMVWTCSMTGKSNLTYSEALQSEENAKKMLHEFPYELRIPLLFLANKTKRKAFGDMAEDVFSFMKDRFFVGENIEACFSHNKWKDYHVLQVIAPTEIEIKKFKPAKPNGVMERIYQPHSSLYKYDLEQLDAEDEDISEKIMVDNSQMRRKKGMYSKEMNKLFLKQYVEQNSVGLWAIKESGLESFGVNKMKFDQIFDGPLPDFENSKQNVKNGKNMVNGKKVKQETMAKFLTKEKSTETSKKNGELLEKMKQRQIDFKKQKEEMKQKNADEKEKKKLEDLKINAMVREWFKAKEDLELEDHAILPTPTTVKSKVPEKHLGDMLCLLEFVNSFSKILKVKELFPDGLTLELMERALMEKEVAGPLIDIVQLLLQSVFNIRDEEAAQYKKSTSSVKVFREDDLPENISMEYASKLATQASLWSRRQQGFTISQLSMYSLTITEILRIHLLSSGAEDGEDCAKWRYQMRGGYTGEDDPGLHLRVHDPHILRALAIHSIVDLNISDKLKILHCLMNQLLTYAVIRDVVEDSRDNHRNNKVKIRSLLSGQRKNNSEHGKGSEEAKQANAIIGKEIDVLLKASRQQNILLGLDRAYRRYVKLESIPGLFVEYNVENAGVCQSDAPIRQFPELIGATNPQIAKHIQHLLLVENTSTISSSSGSLKEELNTSDKENEPKVSSRGSGGKLTNGVGGGGVATVENCQMLCVCTGERSTCTAVHCGYNDLMADGKVTQAVMTSRDRPKWAFFSEESQLDELISSLNRRGMREVELREMLENDMERIRALIGKTPREQLGLASIKLEEDVEKMEVVEVEEVVVNQRPQRQKSKKHQPPKKARYEDANLGYEPETCAAEILHNTIIDSLLEMEEKIYNGNLGQLKLAKGYSRDDWREHITHKQYDLLDATLVNARDLYNVLLESNRPSTPTTEIAAHILKRHKEYRDPGRFIGHDSIESIEESTNSDEISLMQSAKDAKAIEMLSIALAQLAQSVGNKYLKKPLGHADVHIKAITVTKDILPRWQQSLLVSTSFSQLFLHYNTLDSCIMWTRSALNARCRICRRAYDSENMLLCDSCNQGHHLYCLRPKLTSVPKGDWFCIKCSHEKEQMNKSLIDKDTEVIPQKKRRIFRDEDVSDEEEEEEEEVEEEELAEGEDDEGAGEDGADEEEEEIEEVTVVEEDEGEEEEVLEELVGLEEDVEHQVGGESDDDDEDNDDDEDEEVLCKRCQADGELLSCDQCKCAYHLECVDPPLRRLPRHGWTCTDCKEKKEYEDGDVELSSRRSNRRETDSRDDLPLHNAALQELLSDIMKHKDGWPFIRPVQKNEVPDYYNVITRPMDFGTIKYKLNMGKYNFDAEFMADSVLVFENCNTYNNSDAEVYKCGVRLLKHFSKKCNELGLKTPEEMHFDEDIRSTEPKSKKRRTK